MVYHKEPQTADGGGAEQSGSCRNGPSRALALALLRRLGRDRETPGGLGPSRLGASTAAHQPQTA